MPPKRAARTAAPRKGAIIAKSGSQPPSALLPGARPGWRKDGRQESFFWLSAKDLEKKIFGENLFFIDVRKVEKFVHSRIRTAISKPREGGNWPTVGKELRRPGAQIIVYGDSEKNTGLEVASLLGQVLRSKNAECSLKPPVGSSVVYCLADGFDTAQRVLPDNFIDSEPPPESFLNALTSKSKKQCVSVSGLKVPSSPFSKSEVGTPGATSCSSATPKTVNGAPTVTPDGPLHMSFSAHAAPMGGRAWNPALASISEQDCPSSEEPREIAASAPAAVQQDQKNLKRSRALSDEDLMVSPLSKKRITASQLASPSDKVVLPPLQPSVVELHCMETPISRDSALFKLIVSQMHLAFNAQLRDLPQDLTHDPSAPPPSKSSRRLAASRTFPHLVNPSRGHDFAFSPSPSPQQENAVPRNVMERFARAGLDGKPLLEGLSFASRASAPALPSDTRVRVFCAFDGKTQQLLGSLVLKHSVSTLHTKNLIAGSRDKRRPYAVVKYVGVVNSARGVGWKLQEACVKFLRETLPEVALLHSAAWLEYENAWEAHHRWGYDFVAGTSWPRGLFDYGRGVLPMGRRIHSSSREDDEVK